MSEPGLDPPRWNQEGGKQDEREEVQRHGHMPQIGGSQSTTGSCRASP
jgi:hypothetical protein